MNISIGIGNQPTSTVPGAGSELDMLQALETAIGQTFGPAEEQKFMNNLLADLLANNGAGPSRGKGDCNGKSPAQSSGLQALEQALAETLQGPDQAMQLLDNLLGAIDGNSGSRGYQGPQTQGNDVLVMISLGGMLG
jgi:hypothetical protein